MIRYDFYYRMKNKPFTWIHKHHYYVDIEQVLTEKQHEVLKEILISFPHSADNNDWVVNFPQLQCDKYPADLLCIAANAYDGEGNTMLSVACERGRQIAAIAQLIKMGARLDVLNEEHKLALHWAINNRYSILEKDSEEAVQEVQYLLDQGAKTDLICYDNKTPLQYAKSRGFTAAARIIENHLQKQSSEKINKMDKPRRLFFKPAYPSELAHYVRPNKVTGGRVAKALKEISLDKGSEVAKNTADRFKSWATYHGRHFNMRDIQKVTAQEHSESPQNDGYQA